MHTVVGILTFMSWIRTALERFNARILLPLQQLPYCWKSHAKKKQLFVAFPWVETSTGPGGFMICVFII